MVAPVPSTPVVTPDVPAVENITIVNGDAEDTANVKAFRSMYGDNNISIVEDPRNAKNHVWKVEPTKEGKIYVSLFHDVTFTAGKTYKVEYDVCVVSNFKGEAVEKTNVFVNTYYNDDKKNHTKTVSTVPSGEWKHVSVEVTVENTTSDRSKDAIGMFASPVNEMGMVVLMDNFTITAVN